MIEILDPTLDAAPHEPPHLARPASLEGKRVALIDNTKFNSDRLLQKIGDLLKAEHGAASTRMWRKRNASVPIDDAIVAEVRGGFDVAVAGIGD